MAGADGLRVAEDLEPLRHDRRHGHAQAARPTEYFRRQCTIVAFPDDVWVAEAVEQIGPQSITLCSDFPHPNAEGRMPIDGVFRDTNPALSVEDQA